MSFFNRKPDGLTINELAESIFDRLRPVCTAILATCAAEPNSFDLDVEDMLLISEGLHVGQVAAALSARVQELSAARFEDLVQQVQKRLHHLARPFLQDANEVQKRHKSKGISTAGKEAAEIMVSYNPCDAQLDEIVKRIVLMAHADACESSLFEHDVPSVSIFLKRTPRKLLVLEVDDLIGILTMSKAFNGFVDRQSDIDAIRRAIAERIGPAWLWFDEVDPTERPAIALEPSSTR